MTDTSPELVDGNINAAVASERLRVSAILESDEGRRNPGIAADLAFRSALDAQAAIAVLAKCPAANPYLAAMAKEGPTGIGAAHSAMVTDAKAERLAEISAGAKAYNASKGYMVSSNYKA